MNLTAGTKQRRKAVREMSEGPIIRCLRLIRLLTEIRGDISVKEVAQHLDLPPSTTHRLLHVLQCEGYVDKDPRTQRYRAGLDLERMGSLLASRRGMRDLTRPFLQRIVERCGEAAMYVGYLPSTRQVSVMAAINSSNPLRYEMTLYEPHSVAWGATGRSVFAFLPEQEQQEIAATAGPSPALGTPLPPWDELKPELDSIRAAGYVKSEGQKIAGAVGLGAPIRDGAGRVIGSFCITIPQIRFDPASEAEFAHLVKQEAATFSQTA